MNIKEALKKKGKTLTEIAAALHITPSALSQQIANDTLTIKRLKEIANAADISLCELVSGEDITAIRTEIDAAFARIDARNRQWEKERMANEQRERRAKGKAATSETIGGGAFFGRGEGA